MGCIFSYCQKDEDVNESLLFTNRHCMRCNQVFTQNEYNRHIVQCTKVTKNNNEIFF